MADFNWIQSIDVTLGGSGVNSTATSIDVVGFTLPDGTAITTAMLGNAAIGYGTLEPETSREENFSFTGVTDNGSNSYTLTGVTRGLGFVSPYTADAALRLPHSGSTILRLSNSAPFYSEFSVKRNAETLSGVKTFVSTAIPVYDTHPTFTQNTELIDKKYADDLAIAGAPNASTVVQGLVQLPTQAQTDARTATGSTGAALTPTPANLRTVLTHDYVASVVGTDAYAIAPTPAVTAYATGDTYIFKADVANTGAATLEVSGLAAKTILDANGATLLDRAITASSINCVVYDGTNFQLAWTTGDMSLSQSGREIYAASSTGNDTYVVTLSPVPLALVAGFAVRVKVDVGNTGPATLNVNGLGAVALVRPSGTALETGDITAGNVFTAVYDGTNFQISGLVPSALTAGTTSNADTLHIHGEYEVLLESQRANVKCFIGGLNDGLTYSAGGSTGIRTMLSTSINSSAGTGGSLTGIPYVKSDMTSATWSDLPAIKLFGGIILRSIAAGTGYAFGFIDSGSSPTVAPATATLTGRHVAFLTDAGVLYASVADGTTQNRTDISSGLTLTNSNFYEIEMTGSSAIFKVNGTVKATLSTNYPTSGGAVITFSFATNTSAASDCVIKHPFAAKLTNLLTS